MISAPSGSSRRSRKACSGRSTRRNSGRAARSSPAASARRISCNAFLCWFETACRLVSAEMFVASYPLSQERLKNQRRNATNSRSLNPNHYATLLPPLESGAAPVRLRTAGKEIIPCDCGQWTRRPPKVRAPGRPNTTQTRPGIMLTCQSRHWRSDHD